jgi:hypothetical protein
MQLFSTIRCKLRSSTLAPFGPADQFVAPPANSARTNPQGSRKRSVRLHHAAQRRAGYAENSGSVSNMENSKVQHSLIPSHAIAITANHIAAGKLKATCNNVKKIAKDRESDHLKAWNIYLLS